MSTRQEVKQQIDVDITQKVAANSITPDNVGSNMKAVVDLIPDYIILPTPQITRRKIKLDEDVREKLNGITPKRQTFSDLEADFVFPELYYKERFDISFNTYGNTNNWLSLPDKRVELCMVATKSNKRLIGTYTGEGNKDYSTKKIVHPANSTLAAINVNNTIFSGGLATGPANFDGSKKAIRKTEWTLDETLESFGENLYTKGRNGFNNPNITVEIDIRDFFITKSKAFSYPLLLETGVAAAKFTVRKIGNIEVNPNNGRIYKRNSVLFFRVSAGLPDSYDENNNRYNKRVFSDLSTPIYLSPKVANFVDTLEIGEAPTRKVPYVFGHTVTLGVKR